MLEKPAATATEIHALLRNRWSPRAFAATPVSDTQIGSMLEAARWAASGGNGQPWTYVLFPQGHESFARVIEILDDGNKGWAARVPLLILGVTKLTRDSGKPNRTALFDLGLSAANLVLQAEALGLRAHQMGGFDQSKASAAFGIPAGYEPVVMIAVGMQGDPASLPEDLTTREQQPRSRKPVSEIARVGAWDAPWDGGL